MKQFTDPYSIRFTPEQLAQVKQGAGATGRPLSNFVRWAAVRAAQKALTANSSKKGTRGEKQDES